MSLPESQSYPRSTALAVAIPGLMEKMQLEIDPMPTLKCNPFTPSSVRWGSRYWR
jgi:hypothetical protein